MRIRRIKTVKSETLKVQSEVPKTRWHRLLGKMLEELLTPVGIQVITDFPVMSESPECDILLLRKEHKHWTTEQKKRLSDGIRDCNASHILVEFKYTESVNENALIQALCYDYLYKRIQNFDEHEVRTFLISAKTPERATLRVFDYQQSGKVGVYHSSHRILKRICLISLNELSDEPHNAFVRCFASRKKEKASAFNILKQKGLSFVSTGVRRFVESFMLLCLKIGGDDMEIEITPEMINNLGKKWVNMLIDSITTEEIIAKHGKEKILSLMKPRDLLKRLGTEDRLRGLEIEDRLKGLSAEEIEAYLAKLKKTKKKKAA